MSDRDDPSLESDAKRLRDLERRLGERMSEREARAGKREHAGMGALGAAWRMSVELVVAVAVGGLLGLGLDRLFHTPPWIMVVGVMLGFAAGVRGAVRAAYEMQASEAGGEPGAERETDDETR